MTKKEVILMLSDIMAVVDYDTYKEMFLYKMDGYQLLSLDKLIAIVSKHIEIEDI